MGESKKENTNLEEREARGKILNKISLIIVIVLLCAACFGMGFATTFRIVNNTTNAKSNSKKSSSSVTDVVDDKGTTECESNGVTVENLDVTDSLVLNAVDNISHAINSYCGVWDMYSTKQKYTKNDISNTLAFEMVMSNLFKAGHKLDTGDVITKDEFDKVLHSILGSDYKFNYESYKGCPHIDWDESKKQWTVGLSGCGGTCVYRNGSMTVKAIKTDDTLTIYQRVIFYKIGSDDSVRYYADAAKTKDITDSLSTYEEFGARFFKDTAENFNKGALYKLNFTKENDNYVFDSSELIG
jgi:hypothetical protein